jgi:hypothetical protein
MPKAQGRIDLDAALFSYGELCLAAGLRRATVDKWLHRGVLRPTRVGPPSRGSRLFSVTAIFEAKLIGQIVNFLRIPPSTAAVIVKKTTTAVKWMLETAKDDVENKSLDFVVRVSWSEKRRDWDIGIEKHASDGVLKIEIAEPGPRPFAVLPVYANFLSVYKMCVRMLRRPESETRGTV